MRRRNLFTLAAGASAVLCAGGTGCIGIPLREEPRTSHNYDVRTLVGQPSEHRPFQLGVTDREAVIAELGPAHWRTASRRGLGYDFHVNATKWFGLNVVDEKAIFPLIPRYTPAYYYLFLEFDAAGVLDRYALQRRYGYRSQVSEIDDLWKAFAKDVPDEDLGDVWEEMLPVPRTRATRHADTTE